MGIGPGEASWCTPAVRRLVLEATDIVGYDAYLALLDGLVGGALTARRHGSGNRVEAERARLALDLAARGGDVVVVSSGDPGVFGMAAAVCEQLDAHPDSWPGVDLSIEPGISAAQALAARVGAPLGHDFAVVSLSDVLKPWEVVEARLDAAAAAGFVLALYNPRSRHRPWQFARALEVLHRHRPPVTPVVLGRRIGRRGEQVMVTTLGDVDPESVDMSTVVIVGSAATRTVQCGGRALVYTPRRHGHSSTAPAPEPPATAAVTASLAAPAGAPVVGGRWLLTGGARAGKSAYAEQLAARSQRPVTVVVTAQPVDEEMVARIAAHRAARPAGWVTIEEPLDPASAIGSVPDGDCVLLDCVTVWVGNLFHHGVSEAAIDGKARDLAEVLAGRGGPCVVVTNEVGLGLVPETDLGRRYRDVLGRVNATLAAVAHRVVLVCAGRGLELQPLDPIR
ncbi:precorrin-3B C(17)-methyltransferase [Rhabdothermincola sp.]|uniref:precorrin-3B C(17)-methyltransferase n=1 Tax=Rhabdothermincola sp. TaxID=2820405 RepID=UPI002FE0FCC6